MAGMKFDVPLLNRNTMFSLWQLKMRAILAQMDLDDALLGFNVDNGGKTKEGSESFINDTSSSI